MTSGSSEIPRLFEAYRSALRDADLPRAIQPAVEIDETSPSVSELLDDFAAAVENDDLQLANTLLIKIDERYDERAADEEAEVQRAIRAVENARLSESDRTALLTLTEEATQANFARSSFLSEAVAYLEDESGDGSGDIADTAKETEQAEQQFEQAQSENTVSSVESDPELGSSPTVLDRTSPPAVVAGNTATLTVTIGNIGDAETEPLTLETTDLKNTEASPSQVSVGTLAPDERRDVSFDVTPGSEGTARVKIVMKRNGIEIGSTAGEITVRADTKSVKEALSGTSGDVLEPAAIQQAISYWSMDETVPETGGKTVTTERLQAFITEWLNQGESSQ